MSDLPEIKLGWGVPVNLDTRNADIVRGLLESIPEPLSGTEQHRNLYWLRKIFLPPPSECAEAKKIIENSSKTFSGVDFFLEIDDKGYDSQEAQLNGALTDAEGAFKARPVGCEMEEYCDDRYECGRCDFYVHIT